MPTQNREHCISLLIATIARKAPLARLLETLQQQCHQRFEVLIADQNPPGFLDDVLRPFTANLTIIHITMPPCGVSAARNTLLPLATGDIIAFPDDDCWYAPHTLECIVNLFAQNPQAGGVLCAWAENANTSPQGQSLHQVTRTKAFQDAGTIVQFYRKRVLKDIQFDPELGPGTGLSYGCGEDTDLLLQVLATGTEVIRTNSILVYHPKPNFADPALPAKARAYALGRMHLLRKHKFPLWFKLANVAYPLARLVIEGKKAWHYRKAMFWGRLAGLLHKN